MENNLPNISILVAARNEAHQIINCLSHLYQLDYPEGKWEVWVGNDGSTDDTAAVVEGFIKDRPHFHLYHVEGHVGEARGKANVIGQLAHQAQGELYLITDADVTVPRTWAKTYVNAWKPGIGVVTGFTLVEGKTIFAALQGLDWTLALTLIKTSTDLGIPTTSLGNNMMVSAEAYHATGGYDTIPFSVTEDFALFMATVAKGFDFTQLLNRGIMCSTQPMESWGELLSQRQRWMHGAMQIPWYLRLGLVVQVGWFPLMVLLFIVQPLLAVALWGLKILVQSAIITYQLLRLKKPKTLIWLPLYEPYALFAYTAMTFKYYFSKDIVWKGRKF